MRAARYVGLGPILVLVASLLWGTTGTVATFAPGVSPLAIGAAAMGIGGVLQALVAIKPIRRQIRVLRRNWPMITAGAICVALYPLAFYSSMHLAGVAIGTVVSLGSAPLFAAVIERVADRVAFTIRWGVSVGLGLLGMVLLCLGRFGVDGTAADGTAIDSAGTVTPNELLLGTGLGLVAGATYAVYSWAARRVMLDGVTASAAMGSVFGLGGILLIPVLLVTGESLLASLNNAAVGLYMALVPMFLGYVLFGRALLTVSSSAATVLTLFEPVVATVLAVLVVGERLGPIGWTGMMLVGACLVLLTVRAKAKSIDARVLRYG
ncbi:EamA family transporter [Lysinibacter cavernae]|uniref:DME family drug/metabolite transporter n=1 Tax=Lysinibacter cavernae TaxID=1640652 RepID=A0A7X5TRV9_9MICO|nr:DME family drug/metabolite transporter [Lysinibacter cavernae]